MIWEAKEQRKNAKGPRREESGCAVVRVRKPVERAGEVPERFPVIIARGIHLFPYRTQKLSLLALMVLGWKRPGRVGRRRIPKRNWSGKAGGSSRVRESKRETENNDPQ